MDKIPSYKMIERVTFDKVIEYFMMMRFYTNLCFYRTQETSKKNT